MAEVRVLESFPRPRATTNPYIIQLAEALTNEPGVELEYFDWRAALFGNYDVFHMHWPDALLAARTPATRLGKRLAAVALLVRLAVCRTPVVRTLHNDSPHEQSWSARRFESGLDRLTRARVRLNSTDDVADAVVIRHGDYRKWYGRFPRSAAVDGRIGFVGLIRPYKGVEDLITAFRDLQSEEPSVSLDIAGNPRSEQLRASLTAELEKLPQANASWRLEYIDDRELVARVTTSQLIVLPYRRMTNSGVALAALSLDRPVLVPSTPTTRALRDEVGAQWVHLFDGVVHASDISTALQRTQHLAPDDQVVFDGRDWADAGARHLEVFRDALSHTPRRRSRRSAPTDPQRSPPMTSRAHKLSEGGRLAVRIAIPTYKRPTLLERILTEVTAQVGQVRTTLPAVDVSVQIVDNDPAGSGAKPCAAFDVEYVSEPTPGISAVRNRALRDASDQDAIICIDDDEIPADGWLDALLRRFIESDAEAVAGKVITPFPADVSQWLRVSGAFVRPVREDGQVIREAATNNLILDMHTVRAHGLRFDERFGLSGGSDSLFTRQFTRTGARIVWAEHAVMYEQEDRSRLNRDWVLRRTYRFGNSAARVNIALASSTVGRLWARSRVAVRGLARVVSGAMLTAWGRVTRSLSRVGHGERRLARGKGMLAGVFGRVYSEYALRRSAESSDQPKPA